MHGRFPGIIILVAREAVGIFKPSEKYMYMQKLKSQKWNA